MSISLVNLGNKMQVKTLGSALFPLFRLKTMLLIAHISKRWLDSTRMRKTLGCIEEHILSAYDSTRPFPCPSQD